MTAENILREYARRQARLCNALFERHPVEDVTRLSDLPRQGVLALDDDDWEFSQHGIGVCFTSVADGEVVNARAWVFAYPAGFDACRLKQHLESKNIGRIAHGEMTYNATMKSSLGKMLECLRREGLLVLVDAKAQIYMLNDDTPPAAAAVDFSPHKANR